MNLAHPVAVIAERDNGGLAPLTFEALAAAQALAGSDRQVVVLLVGPPGTGQLASKLGEATVYVAEHPALEQPDARALAQALAAACRAAQASVVICGLSPLTRQVTPYLAALLGAGLAMNATALRWEADRVTLAADCPVYGGGAICTYQIGPEHPAVIGVRPGAFSPSLAAAGEATIHAVPLAPDALEVRVRVLGRRTQEGPSLENARVVVCGGLGLLDQPNYRHIEDLARVLGGAPAATRAIVDRGWVTPAYQVGITGRTVTAELYIAAGISGASQHMAGCSNARTIVAINNDRNAPIFRYAAYGVIADCVEFLPAFLAACQRAISPGAPVS